MRQKKGRDATGLFLVEGIAHVGAALDANATIEYICYAPDSLTSDYGKQLVAQAAECHIPCLAVSDEVFDSISDKDNPSGLLAIVRKPTSNLQSLISNSLSWHIALLSPQDPGNIGAILRTMDAVNATGLILLDGGADPYHPSAVRASIGALFYKPVMAATFSEFVAWAKGHNYNIIGASAKASTDYRTAEYKRPLILLLGSEQKGLSSEQMAACDQLIQLPMEGKVSSLNLAVAAGVMMYAILAHSRSGRREDSQLR